LVDSVESGEWASGGQCPKETAMSNMEESPRKCSTVRFPANATHKIVCSACKQILQREVQRKQGQ
jgi:hypothetical protein